MSLQIISAGLQKQTKAVVAALAAIRQLGACLLRGSSPWKSAALLIRAIMHVMQQRQLVPEVAEVCGPLEWQSGALGPILLLQTNCCLLMPVCDSLPRLPAIDTS